MIEEGMSIKINKPIVKRRKHPMKVTAQGQNKSLIKSQRMEMLGATMANHKKHIMTTI